MNSKVPVFNDSSDVADYFKRDCEAKLKVQLLEYTPNAEELIAKAAKLCYSASGVDEIAKKLTPESIAKFLDTLSDLGHESPIEHVSFTFAIEGVSRTLTHQLVRHRIASYSQQSQRYVKLDQFQYIIPPAIKDKPNLKKLYIEMMEQDQKNYDTLVYGLVFEYIREFLNKKGISFSAIETELSIPEWFKTQNKKKYMEFEKMAIEDARYVFPNACETKIVVTMNARTLMNFFRHRCCNRAQWEIRNMAWQMLLIVNQVAPSVFRYAGPPCLYNKCPEGNMSCKNPYKKNTISQDDLFKMIQD